MTNRDETSGLLENGGQPSRIGKSSSYKVPLEALRCSALAAGVVLLLVGLLVTETFVRFGDDETFVEEKTFIYRTFHFSHTCTYLDFNPAKTISALVLMFHTIPMNIFIILSHLKIVYEYDNGINGVDATLLLYSRITTPIMFVFFMYFYMVFVNSPDGDSMLDFTLHYIPYMCWQSAMIMLAIRQSYYLARKEAVDGNIAIPVRSCTLRIYCYFLVCLFLYYTTFVWSFIFGVPILDTTVPWKMQVGKAIMYGFDFFAVIIPMCFAFWATYTKNTDAFFVVQVHNMETETECDKHIEESSQ